MLRLPATIRELGAAALAAGAALAGAVVLEGTAEAPARWVLAGGLASGLFAMQLAFRAVRGVAGSDRAVQVEVFRHLEQHMVGLGELADPAREFLRALEEVLGRAAGLGQARLYASSGDGGRLVETAPGGDEGGREVALDRRARAWLQANPRPIDSGHLSELPLGSLRQLIEQLVRAVGGDLVLPLVHRGQLVGVATAQGNARRALRGISRDTVQAVQDAAASALAELHLRAQTDMRSAVEREVERAAQVNLEGDGPLAEELAGWQVVRSFYSAHPFSGSWWTATTVPGQRLLIALGEVTGHGVPAALLAASAIGVCEAAAATLGPSLEPQAVLELVSGSVGPAGGDAYRMSCFVALFDAAARQVDFAGAGHPFPYVCRASGRARLGSLVSRGNLLGGDAPPRRSARQQAIGPGDVVVFCSAGAIIARAPDGDIFGERRLRRVLERLHAPAAGFGPANRGMAERIANAVRSHAGPRPLDDDLLIMTAALAPRGASS